MSPHRWFLEHDDRYTFIAPYVALSVFASVFVSLFWLAALIGVHFGIELYRQRHLAGRQTFAHAAWEVKLDLALFLLSITLVLYMDIVFGLLGLNAASRAGAAAARAGARSAAIQRGVRTFLLTIDDLIRIAGIVFATRGIGRGIAEAASESAPATVEVATTPKDVPAPANAPHTHPSDEAPSDHTDRSASSPWTGPWALGDRISIVLGALALLLVALAPWLSGHGLDGVFDLIAEELNPLPGGD